MKRPSVSNQLKSFAFDAGCALTCVTIKGARGTGSGIKGALRLTQECTGAFIDGVRLQKQLLAEEKA